MIEFYAEIKFAHVAAVLASGCLFLLRGILVQVGRNSWALAPLPRYLSYAIDTTLLTAAFMLLTILPATVYGNAGWSQNWHCCRSMLLSAGSRFAARPAGGWVIS